MSVDLPEGVLRRSRNSNAGKELAGLEWFISVISCKNLEGSQMQLGGGASVQLHCFEEQVQRQRPAEARPWVIPTLSPYCTEARRLVSFPIALSGDVDASGNVSARKQGMGITGVYQGFLAGMHACPRSKTAATLLA